MAAQYPARVVLSLCFTVALASQEFVPAVMDGVEGGGGTNIPFGGSLACRYQCIYDAEELPWSGPRVLTGFRVRPDFGTGAMSPAKGFLTVSVLMSTTSKTSATSSPIFADNYGRDAQWVIENRVMQLPAQPVLTAGPRPANIDFTFDFPWVYGLTPIVQGFPEPDNLLVEIWIKAQPSGSYRVDNLSSCTAAASTFGLVGPGCTTPNNPPVLLEGDASMQAGSSYTWRVEDAPPSTPFWVSLDVLNTGGLLGNPLWPLPYPLFDPANPSQPSQALALTGLTQSAPDCYLNISPTVTLGGLTDTMGEGAVTVQLPAGRQYVGTTLFTQAIVLAPTANPLFVITSLGLSTTVCGPLGVARVFQFYDNTGQPPPPRPASGSRNLGVGLIIDVF